MLAIANRICFKPEMMHDLLFFAEEWFKQYETVESLKTVDTLGKLGKWKES